MALIRTRFVTRLGEKNHDTHTLNGNKLGAMSMVQPTVHRNSPLAAIKALHTLVWAFMAACVFALPIVAFAGHFRWAAVLTAIILGECLVLAANRGRCPLTDWAARYTDERSHNFDIYLPNCLARHNKVLFGTLFVLNETIVVWRWLLRP